MSTPSTSVMSSNQLAGSGPILVTGTPYSGTTWLGETLSRVGRLPYFHEPFNVNSPLFGYGLGFRQQFTFVTPANEREHLDAFRRLESLRPEVRMTALLRDVRRFRCEFSEWRRRVRDRWEGGRSLWKDPMAVLSTGWIAARFDASVVVIARHPAAFALAAMNRSGGRSGASGVGGILAQPLFMERYGDRYGPGLEAIGSGRLPPHVEKATFWRVLLEVALHETRDMEDRIRLVRYEDACEHPEAVMPRLLDDLGVDPRRDIAEVLEKSSRRHAHKRRGAFDRSASLHGWRDRFSSSEVDEIFDAAGPLAKTLFDGSRCESADDWSGRTIDAGRMCGGIDEESDRVQDHRARSA